MKAGSKMVASLTVTPAAKPAKVARAVRHHPQDLITRTDAVLTAIDAFLADRTGHNLGPPLDDVDPAPGSLEAVRAALLQFRATVAAPSPRHKVKTQPVIAAGMSLWASVRGLMSTFTDEAAKSGGHEFGKWGARGFVLLVGYMVLDVLTKAGFDLSDRSLGTLQELLRQALSGASS
jgi:hypothetical protein